MALRVWLHEGHDGEPGCEAWALDVLGFATWARTREEVDPGRPGCFFERRRRRLGSGSAARTARAACGSERPPRRGLRPLPDGRVVVSELDAGSRAGNHTRVRADGLCVGGDHPADERLLLGPDGRPRTGYGVFAARSSPSARAWCRRSK